MNFILLGPPGSGKGTQGAYLEKKLGIHRISTGELLRREVEAGSDIGNKIQASLGTGQFTSDEIVLEILKKELTDSKYQKGFILDGVPRNLRQAQVLSTLLQEQDKNINRVFYFHISEDDLVERICNRYYCVNCGTNYNKLFKNPVVAEKCDVCGSTTFNVRSDDRAETVKNRFEEYKKQTAPLITYYKNKNILCTIDGTKDIAEIAKEIDKALKS